MAGFRHKHGCYNDDTGRKRSVGSCLTMVTVSCKKRQSVVWYCTSFFLITVCCGRPHSEGMVWRSTLADWRVLSAKNYVTVLQKKKVSFRSLCAALECQSSGAGASITAYFAPWAARLLSLWMLQWWQCQWQQRAWSTFHTLQGCGAGTKNFWMVEPEPKPETWVPVPQS